MPVDNPEIIQAAGLVDLQGRRESVTEATHEKATDAFQRRDSAYDNLPTEAELEGPNALRRVAAPIPWAVYTVAFVELCERFSYYGTQVVCKYFQPDICWGDTLSDLSKTPTL